MRANKYGAQQTVLNGITFDSKMESMYYTQLNLMERAGLISDLELQPEFVLIPAFKKLGRTIRATKYRADFKYKEQGKTIVVDVKGVKTKDFNIKRKLFDSKYPDIELKLITYKNGGWEEI
ncbi:DUF1064 domain-containing protein [Paenibacillus polymyxa]|uniref:DUF1064 domain-containing protein n=1 Tax=Paenibacillus polymyxa TaxID=1406 RepID=UPI00298CEC1A|nr:DUF1064 domain-containing protein [Paenibacillus polymyxa]